MKIKKTAIGMLSVLSWVGVAGAHAQIRGDELPGAEVRSIEASAPKKKAKSQNAQAAGSAAAMKSDQDAGAVAEQLALASTADIDLAMQQLDVVCGRKKASSSEQKKMRDQLIAAMRKKDAKVDQKSAEAVLNMACQHKVKGEASPVLESSSSEDAGVTQAE